MVKVDMSLTPNGKDCQIMLDGVDVSNDVRAVEVRAEVGEVTHAVLEYVCYEEPTGLAGEFDVEHRCPISWGELALVVDRDDETKAQWYPVTKTFIDRGGVRRLRSTVKADGE